MKLLMEVNATMSYEDLDLDLFSETFIFPLESKTVSKSITANFQLQMDAEKNISVLLVSTLKSRQF